MEVLVAGIESVDADTCLGLEGSLVVFLVVIRVYISLLSSLSLYNKVLGEEEKEKERRKKERVIERRGRERQTGKDSRLPYTFCRKKNK